jgi:hypothetical protein
MENTAIDADSQIKIQYYYVNVVYHYLYQSIIQAQYNVEKLIVMNVILLYRKE